MSDQCLGRPTRTGAQWTTVLTTASTNTQTGRRASSPSVPLCGGLCCAVPRHLAAVAVAGAPPSRANGVLHQPTRAPSLDDGCQDPRGMGCAGAFPHTRARARASTHRPSPSAPRPPTHTRTQARTHTHRTLQARSALYDLDNIRLDDLGASKTLYAQQTDAGPEHSCGRKRRFARRSVRAGTAGSTLG